MGRKLQSLLTLDGATGLLLLVLVILIGRNGG
jgi:hypothetical protein